MRPSRFWLRPVLLGIHVGLWKNMPDHGVARWILAVLVYTGTCAALDWIYKDGPPK